MRYGFLFALFKRSHDHLRGFLIAAWAGDKIAEFSFPEILFHFPLRPWFFFVSPAYAGKRTKSSRCPPRMWDHPRVCGEKNLCILRRVEIPGSPPRMRGKAPTKTGCSCPGGITPAYAGKRREDCDMGMYDRDHPRVCGEKSVCRAKFCADGGITPAYAGKSFACADRRVQ